ncbi:MAG TPA: FixH family protein [Saprospiraceae bacterium]|nr:FixH family protein [Saprospiraceae bacterium]
MSKSKWTHSGNLIMAGFGFMLLFISFLVYKSLNIDFQMSDKNYYESEMKYNEVMEAEANTSPFEKDFSLTTSDNTVQLKIPSSLSAGLKDGKVIFYCISDEKNDRTVTINPSPEGLYSISTAEWKKTSYRARISFVNTGKSYFREIPFSI